jgi:ferredoxin
MPYVVTDNCKDCRFTDCVTVCPVDCFYFHNNTEEKHKNMIFINPDECIDCGACLPECPVEAIYPEEDLPDELKHFLDVNAKYSGDDAENVTDKQDPLPGADKRREDLGFS